MRGGLYARGSCAYISIYKEDKQKETIQKRLRERKGLVCANTRDVERVMPRGGVTYDETQRRGTRIKDEDMYRMMKRWPRRDKCGRTDYGRNITSSLGNNVTYIAGVGAAH